MKKTQCSVAADVLHSVFFGGDQLTHKRAETAKELRKKQLYSKYTVDGNHTSM